MQTTKIIPFIFLALTGGYSQVQPCKKGGIKTECDNKGNCVASEIPPECLKSQTVSNCEKEASKVKCDDKGKCVAVEIPPDCLKPHISKRPQTVSNCKKDQFSCNSGQCIQMLALCDGFPDCNDGSDETNAQCSGTRCLSNSFQCAYGACIELENKCNGIKDCNDGSDESADLCSHSSTPTSPVMSSGTSCRVPEKKEGTNYRIYSEECMSENTRSKCHLESGTLVPELTNLIYRCDRGYALGSDTDYAVCRNGSWYMELQCLKLCKALVAEFMELKCFYQGQIVPCDVEALPGTIVRPSCSRFYTSILPYDLFKATQCSTTGEWDLPLYRCFPVCGRRWYNSWQTLIAHGTNTTVGEYPWHVGLYELQKGHFEHICGGTIISPYLILTAAHCVFNDVSLTLQNPGKLRVVVGKYYISWDREDRYEQRFEIKRIIPSHNYGGSTNSYSDDIAALELNRRISFSNVVQPACLHFRETVPLRNGAWGTVVGWGHDEFSTPTNELRAANLTYMDRDTCRANAPFEFLMSITSDKFCAGSKDSSVQPGDSGGGFTVVLENRHYLFGIVSIRPNNSTSFAAYTSIAKHIDWIINLMADLRIRHPV